MDTELLKTIRWFLISVVLAYAFAYFIDKKYQTEQYRIVNNTECLAGKGVTVRDSD